ncbi:(2Fe-2S) ferredoxin domain-containing protein [Nocardioides sp. CER19]|uniref:(2Fe-2S) ferredoxin domain-containing protein n=1 Tax=Nocardioides sp. CER19 TaxID=3038538 RepID=UPI00244CDC08|nr:(2Fe-2S) ferredoxin domain-containing protein [Nocardioides sp. CER19]MDH2416027.1 (2Fe-2S) ferredoxin domain-containing protein [Nocardioides sp. CER19]
MTGPVLVGMSVADVDRRDELVRGAADLGGTVAFLQMADPALAAELTRLADAGARAITLVGVSLGPLAPAHSWLRRIAAHWWRERAGERPEIRVATRLADRVDAVVDVLTETRALTGTEPGLTSAAWEEVSAHRHQVLVCRGPRCTAKGSVDSLRAMVLALMEHRLGDDDVLLVHTGCQFPCNQAPVVSVQPDDVWYGRVDPPTAAAIVADHLVAGRPVEGHRLARRASMATGAEVR